MSTVAAVVPVMNPPPRSLATAFARAEVEPLKCRDRFSGQVVAVGSNTTPMLRSGSFDRR